jgi:tRNA (guanine37-N1)-methyltransferase
MKIRAFDILGSVAIVNFPRDFKTQDKQKFAKKIMKEQRQIKTVLEKTEKVKGRLRKPHTIYIAGEKTKEVLYRENGCIFRFNVDNTYFSPRLSNERKDVASMIKPNKEVFVMFAGVAPFSIVIAKNSKCKKVYSNELNRNANKYAELNIELNKVKDKVELVNGDIKKIAKKLSEKRKRFDVIVMPRPQLKDSFLKEAFMLSKKNTKIYYYDFSRVDETERIIEKIKKEARECRKKIKILNTKAAGEIAPYKIRFRVDFIVL